MINYVWLGLILLAVVYAGFLDITGYKTTTRPEPIALYDFQGSQKLDVGEVVSATEADEAASATNQVAAFPVVFSADRRAIVPTNLSLALPEGSGKPATFELKVALSGIEEKTTLLGTFVDARGDLFLAEFSSRLDGTSAWKSGRFSLDTLAASTDNPTAKPQHPLVLREVQLVRASGAAEAATGRLFLDDFSATFPETARVKDYAKGGNWMAVLTKSSAHWAGSAITLAIELIGIIMFWLGLMRIAEQAGLVQFLARMLRPIMIFLFPKIPADGEAMGAIVMNVAANMLGLGNAATPLGLKAMEELQKINENKDYASDAQCMLLAINTSSVTIIAPTIIGYRAAAGSADIMKFWPIMIGATLISTFFAVLGCKILEKLPMFKLPLPPQLKEASATNAGGTNQ